MKFEIANKLLTDRVSLMLRSFAVSTRCLSHTQEHSKIQVIRMMPLETFEGAWENRIWEGWRWESRYKRNNVYNAPFRRNSKFVSLSTIIFRNLHANRFRGPCAKWNKGNTSSFGSPLYRFLHFHPFVLKGTTIRRVIPALFPIIRGSATLKFYPFRFRGWSIARNALVNVRKMTLRFHIFFRVVERIYYGKEH